MRRRLMLLVAMLLGLAGCSPPPGIAVVDLEAVARALGRDEVMSRRVDALNETLRMQLREQAEQLRGELQAEQDALTGDDAGEAQRERFEELLQAANRTLEESQRVAVARAARFQQAVVTDFRREVAAIAREVAGQQGIPAVLSSDASLLWYDSALDITDEVIAEMRARARDETTAGPEVTEQPEPPGAERAGEQR